MIDVLKYKNVIGYAEGRKRIAGRRTEIDAHIFYVSKKENISDSSNKIPSSIKGKPTDVVEIGEMKSLLLPEVAPATRQKTITPLRGGIQIGCELNTNVGTLGAIVKDNKTGRLLGMTNAHVANMPVWNTKKNYGGIIGSAVGYKIYQASQTANLVGKVVMDKPRDVRNYNKYDVSFFDLSPDIGVTVGIMGITKKPQVLINPRTIPDNVTVYKSGRTSGVTSGNIEAQGFITVTAGIDSEQFVYMDQILIKGDNLNQQITDYGDSGSAFCVDLGNGTFGIFGILHSGSETESGESYAIASPIDVIAYDFDVSAWDGSIVLGSDAGLYAAAGGALYENGEITFLDETNTSVCSTGTLEQVLQSSCIDGNLTVKDAVSELKSYSSIFKTSDINIITVVLFVYAAMNANVVVKLGCQAKTGIRLNANINTSVTTESSVSVEMAVRNNINLGFDISTSTVNSLALGANAIINSKVFVGVDCLTYLSTGEVSIGFADAVFIVTATTLSLSGVGQTATAVIDLGLNVYISTAISQIGGLIFGDPVLAVAACDGGNCDDLSYGGML